MLQSDRQASGESQTDQTSEGSAPDHGQRVGGQPAEDGSESAGDAKTAVGNGTGSKARNGSPPNDNQAYSVKLSDVSLSYGKTEALKGVSLDIPQGKMVGLIGPDGVGKSSLLSLISGAHAVQKGTVDVLGGDMREKAHRDQVCPLIAYMPQGLGKNLYQTLSVEENLQFFARLFGHGPEERRKRIDELTKSTGMYSFLDRPAGKLSGGMKQKLGLCCALIHDPALLILDEPTTGVDPLARAQFWDLINRIRKGQPEMSVIVATAYMDEAERFDWLFAMDDGKVLDSGTPKEIMEKTGADSLEAAFIALLPEEKRQGYKPVEIQPLKLDDNAEVAIEAKDLTKRFGNFVAVDHVSFRIQQGEIFGFLGSNGSGKSTTMKMLTGLLPASEGKAWLLGQEVNPHDINTRRKVGYMSQAFSLYSELTVRQNLVLHARLFHVPEDELDKRADEMIERFNLKGVEHKLPEDMPLGVRQRLSLAVATVHKPSLLILDEPTSGVDPVARDDFWRLMIRLSRDDKVTIFISTHFMNEAERCDRISLMHQGKVLDSDTPEKLVEKSGQKDLEQAFIKYLLDAGAGNEEDYQGQEAPEGQAGGQEQKSGSKADDQGKAEAKQADPAPEGEAPKQDKAGDKQTAEAINNQPDGAVQPDDAKSKQPDAADADQQPQGQVKAEDPARSWQAGDENKNPEAREAGGEQAAAKTAAGPDSETAPPKAQNNEQQHEAQKPFSLRRLNSYMWREALELRRDPVRATLALAGSLILMLVIGFGISMDVDNLTYAVLDRDRTGLSNSYALNISGSRYFIEQEPLQSYEDLDRRMRNGEISLAIEIPPGFGRYVQRGDPVAVGAWVDGAMPQRAETVRGYVQAMHQLWLVQQARENLGVETTAYADIEIRYRYNPDVKSLPSIVPAVIPILLLMLPAVLAALSVVREKEMGSIINLYVTPVTKTEFLIGKQIPYIVLAMANYLLMVLLAVTVFGVPLKGSFLTMTLAAFLYSISATGFGLLASTFTKSQIAALFITMVGTLLPAIQFAGMINPTSSLQGAGRAIGEIYPTTHMLTISRGVFNKALGFGDLAGSFLPLALAIPVILGLSILLLNKQEK